MSRPAFYALESGGWRDYLTLIHAPYTAWHLSYVVIGAALAPELDDGRLLAALAAFFLAMGVGAHALDELNGRPLRTRIPDRVLIGLAALSIAAAVAIGLAGGRFHSDLWFGLAWGSFPLLAAYVVTAERLSLAALLGAVFALLTSLAQRTLSTEVRTIRRSGSVDAATAQQLVATPERALRLLALSMVVLAAALYSLRW